MELSNNTVQVNHLEAHCKVEYFVFISAYDQDPHYFGFLSTTLDLNC